MAKSKLDAYLKYRVAPARREWGTTRPTAAAGARKSTAGPRVNVLLELTEAAETIPPALGDAGFNPHVRAGAIWSGDVPRDVVPDLDDIDGIKRVEFARHLGHELDAVLPEVRIPAPPAGQTARRRVPGPVVVGIIDSGVDFRHPAFLQDDGSSSILAIWDQNLKRGEGDHHPQGFTYGVEYSRDAITEAVKSGAGIVRHRDIPPYHGTRVAGIIAGNGDPPHIAAAQGRQPFIGVATGCGLVVVAKTRGPQHGDPGTLGDSADTLDAIHYILELAAARNEPVVVNHSEGDNIGPHDGSSLLERAIDHLFEGRQGRVMLKSAGNEGDKGHHAQGILDGHHRNDVTITVAPGLTEVIVDIWSREGDDVRLQIIPPRGTATNVLAPPFNDNVAVSNGNVAYVDADVNDPGNGRNRTFVVLQKGQREEVEATDSEATPWTFRLTGTGSWHAWIQRDTAAVFDEPFVNPDNTISIPGTSRSVITVGCYRNKGLYVFNPGTLSPLSSRGPTLDGRPAPTLTAPGDEVSAPQPDPVFFGEMKGTSMSAPVVAGAAAIMLAINPALTSEEVRDILYDTAHRDALTEAGPQQGWGAGKLDIQAACARVRELMHTPSDRPATRTAARRGAPPATPPSA